MGLPNDPFDPTLPRGREPPPAAAQPLALIRIRKRSANFGAGHALRNSRHPPAGPQAHDPDPNSQRPREVPLIRPTFGTEWYPDNRGLPAHSQYRSSSIRSLRI